MRASRQDGDAAWRRHVGRSERSEVRRVEGLRPRLSSRGESELRCASLRSPHPTAIRAPAAQAFSNRLKPVVASLSRLTAGVLRQGQARGVRRCEHRRTVAQRRPGGKGRRSGGPRARLSRRLQSQALGLSRPRWTASQSSQDVHILLRSAPRQHERDRPSDDSSWRQLALAVCRV